MGAHKKNKPKTHGLTRFCLHNIQLDEYEVIHNKKNNTKTHNTHLVEDLFKFQVRTMNIKLDLCKQTITYELKKITHNF